MEETGSFITLADGNKMPKFGLGVYQVKNKNFIFKCITEVGYRHIDTAIWYGNETIVGEAIHMAIDSGIKREEIFITTKVWSSNFDDPVAALTGSLTRLNLEYVDMYLIHWPINDFDEEKKEFAKYPMYKVWAQMEKCVEKGLTKSIGISNFKFLINIFYFLFCRIQ